MFFNKVRLFGPYFYYLFYLHGFKYLYLHRRKMYVICCALGTTSIFLSQQVISEMQYVNNEKSKISMVSHKEISECEHDSPCLLELKYIIFGQYRNMHIRCRDFIHFITISFLLQVFNTPIRKNKFGTKSTNFEKKFKVC